MKNEKQELLEQKKHLMKEYEYYDAKDPRDSDQKEELNKLLENLLKSIGSTEVRLKELKDSQPHTWCPYCGKSMDEIGETDGMPVYKCERCDKEMAEDVILIPSSLSIDIDL